MIVALDLALKSGASEVVVQGRTILEVILYTGTGKGFPLFLICNVIIVSEIKVDIY